jgi:hypothetical protein
MKAGVVVPIIPPPDVDADPVSSNVQLPQQRWDDLEAIAQHETAKDAERAASSIPKRRGRVYSRTKIIDFLLKWAVEQYWKEEGGKPKNRK